MFAEHIIQFLALVLLLGATILSVCCVALPYWKVNHPEDVIRDGIDRYEGLWSKCALYDTLNWDCDDVSKFLRFFPAEEIKLTTRRRLSLSAVAFAGQALLIMSLALDAIPYYSAHKTFLRRVRLMSAFFACIASILLLVTVSWYAWEVRTENEEASMQLALNSTYNTQRYVYGVCLYLGWFASGLMILDAILIFFTSCITDSCMSMPLTLCDDGTKSNSEG